MSKGHTIYVLVDADGKYVDAYLSFSEATRDKSLGRGVRIVVVYGREDY